MSFENMVAVVEAELEKIASEMNETDEVVGEGTSITDLINAANTADGKVVFDEVDAGLVETMKEEQDQVEEVVETTPEEIVETPVVEAEPVVEAVEEVQVQKPEPASKGSIFDDEAHHRGTPDQQR